MDEGLIPPRILRPLAAGLGLFAIALPALVVKLLTLTTPPQEARDAGPLRPEMVVVPEGTYTIGSPETESGRFDEETQHRVTLSRRFAIAVTEVTQAQYRRVMGENPSKDKSCGGACPVTDVSWLDAIGYLNALSARDDTVEPCYLVSGEQVEWVEDCVGYRLPTEAEWEVAARAESVATYAGTKDPAEVCRYGNVADSAFEAENPDEDREIFKCNDGFAGLSPVARFRPNGFTIHDMTGNVWEWVWDWYDTSYYREDATDPRGPSGGWFRVVRGGSFADAPRDARVAFRLGGEPSNRSSSLGFRVVRSLP